MSLFRNRYRIESSRLSGWDYASAGYYFVTIATHGKTCFFGEVIEGGVKLSAVGEMVKHFWEQIPVHFPGIELDEFVVMPNHLHGIIVIRDNMNATDRDDRGGGRDGDRGGGRDGGRDDRRDVACYVSTGSTGSTRSNPKSLISPAAGSLGAVIRSFKAAVTTWCRKNEHPFAWQPRYHDQIIRDEGMLFGIREYIVNNPAQWREDHETA